MPRRPNRENSEMKTFRSKPQRFNSGKKINYRTPIRYRNASIVGVLLCLIALLPSLAAASLVRVHLGIWGGRAIDMDSCVDGAGEVRVVSSVEGDAAGYVTDAATSSWRPFFYGRPGQIQELEIDRTSSSLSSTACSLFTLLYDGRVFVNNSMVTGGFSRVPWALSDGGGVLAAEYGTTLTSNETGVYLGTASGNIYRTIDGGVTWTLLATPSAGSPVRSIAPYVDHGSGWDPTLWAVAEVSGVATLFEIPAPYTSASVVSVSGSPVIERVHVYPDTSIATAPLLFVTGDSPSESVYRGLNGGVSGWTTTTEARHYFQEMRFDAANARIYAVSGVSTDYGVTFNSLPNFSRTEGDIHPNDGTMVIDPVDPATVYYASDWFIGEWQFSGTGWTPAGEVYNNDRVAAILNNSMDQVPNTPVTKDTFIIGGKSGVGITSDFLTSAPTPTWTFPIYPQSDGAPVSATRIQDYDGDGVVMENVFAGNNGGKIYRSTTQGLTAASYTQVFTPAVDAVGYFDDVDRIEIRDIMFSATNKDHMYAGFGDWDTGRVGGGVACSTNNGLTWAVDAGWVALANPMKVNALHIMSSNFVVGVGKQDDPNLTHRGLYETGAAPAGCASGTFSQVVTGTALDGAVIHDIAGSLTGPMYVASSAGLFRGDGTWTDISGALGLPSGDWKATTYNPTPPAGCAEEFFGAVGDQVYRIRDCGTSGYVAALISPTPFEEVRVMLWDELIIGGDSSVSSLGHAKKRTIKCRAGFDKARDKYVNAVAKALGSCRNRELDGVTTCPDAQAQAAIDKAAGKLGLAKRCGDDYVVALSDSWASLCTGAGSTEELEACLIESGDAAVDAFAEGHFGPSPTSAVSLGGTCESGMTKTYARVLKTALKSYSKCERSIEKEQETSCPNDAVLSSLDRAARKAAAKLGGSCTDADAVALNARGLPDVCAPVSTVEELAECQMSALSAILDDLLTPEQTEF